MEVSWEWDQLTCISSSLQWVIRILIDSTINVHKKYVLASVLSSKLREEEGQEKQLGDYAGDDDCGFKEEDVGVVDLADAGVEFLVHGHQVLLVCNTWNEGLRT